MLFYLLFYYLKKLSTVYIQKFYDLEISWFRIFYDFGNYLLSEIQKFRKNINDWKFFDSEIFNFRQFYTFGDILFGIF